VIDELLKIAVRNLTRRKVRTFFTMLGIIIAVGSITALVSITEGSNEAVQGELERTSNVLMVIPGASLSIVKVATSSMDESIVHRIEKINHVKAVNPILYKISSFHYDGYILETSIMGIDPRRAQKYYELVGFSMERGAFLRKGDRYKAALGYLVAHGKFAGANGEVSMVEVYVDDIYFVDQVKEEIEKRIGGVTVISAKQSVEMVLYVQKIMHNLLIGIGSIALFVGALGVMNTLLTSVMERTREIGTYRAIGAKKSFILKMILIEGLILTSIGGALGFAFGIGAANFVVWVFKQRGQILPSPIIDLNVILFAIAITFGIGLLSSIYPAKKAADLSPVEALRYIE